MAITSNITECITDDLLPFLLGDAVSSYNDGSAAYSRPYGLYVLKAMKLNEPSSEQFACFVIFALPMRWLLSVTISRVSVSCLYPVKFCMSATFLSLILFPHLFVSSSPSLSLYVSLCVPFFLFFFFFSLSSLCVLSLLPFAPFFFLSRVCFLVFSFIRLVRFMAVNSLGL